MAGNKILIIDDEQVVRLAMKKALKDEEYTLYYAGNGEEGLNLFGEILPDLVFLDLRMPIMDGYAFLEKINIRPDDPFLVIVITGHGEDREVQKCFELGVNFFLRKPLSMVEVCCLTRRCLALKANEHEIRQHRDNLARLVSEKTQILEDQVLFQQTLIDSIPTPIFYKNTKGQYLGCNIAFAELCELPPEDLLGKTAHDLQPVETADEDHRIDGYLLQHGGIKNYEIAACFADGRNKFHAVCKTVYKDKTGRTAGLLGASFDITELVTTKTNLIKRTQELEEVNTALRVLLKEMNKLQENTEIKIVKNIQESIMPYLDEAEEAVTVQQGKPYIEMARTNLKRITSSFTQRLSSSALNLSPREIQVADYVKIGKSNKETAKLMKISPNAVEFHRNNLRQKLGLKGKRSNLRTHLMNLE